jgi:hypothetical protein
VPAKTAMRAGTNAFALVCACIHVDVNRNMTVDRVHEQLACSGTAHTHACVCKGRRNVHMQVSAPCTASSTCSQTVAEHVLDNARRVFVTDGVHRWTELSDVARLLSWISVEFASLVSCGL